MNNSNNLTEVKKIELLFDKQDNFPKFNNEDTKNIKNIKTKHLLWIPSLFYKKIYQLLPGILKDIFFSLSGIHKSPTTKLFARTKYQELRTLIDNKISALFLRSVPTKILKDVQNTFNTGSYTLNLTNLSEIDILVGNVINYANPSNAGAQPYFKDGKKKKINNSYSAYYDFSKKDSKKISLILRNSIDKNFNYHLSALAGYKCELKDMSYGLGVVYGENSNSEMHQDTYGSTVKGFIYLQDVHDNDSPFQYLEGSYLDRAFRAKKTNISVLNNDDFYSSGSTRLRGLALEEAFKKYSLRTFTGSKGLMIIANTAGYHRKGVHNSTKPRITLSGNIERKGAISKLLNNLLSIIKFKLF